MRTVVLLATLALLGCDRDPTQASFSQNVGTAFEECNPAEIRFLAGKHNFMTAFEPCGSNHFQHYAWAPDGKHLYFQLTHAAHVMNAEAADKRTITVPTETPIGPAAWLSSSRLVVPIGPEEGDERVRMALFDHDQKTVSYRPVPEALSELDHLTPGDSPSSLLFSAVKGEKRRIYELDLDDGALGQPWGWAKGLDVDTFTYTPEADAVAIGAAGKVTLYSTEGAERGSWAPARRGVLHPDGRWMALEHDGEAVSIFYQRSWDELSERARTRELARAEQFEERLPEWYPREVSPPTISLVDLADDTRWVFTGFQGKDFQWYEARDYYASVILWGFEGKELNRNVVLGNLADRMKSMERGEEMLGVQRWRPADVEAQPAPGETPSVEPTDEAGESDEAEAPAAETTD